MAEAGAALLRIPVALLSKRKHALPPLSSNT